MTINRKPNVFVTAWRYFTGAHLDGRIYTNATWTKPGTHPKQKLTWWNSRPRFLRAAIRDVPIIGIPAWLWLYVNYHYWTVVITLAVTPYVIHNGWWLIYSRAKQGVRIPEHLQTPASSQNVIAELTFTDDDAGTKPARKAQ